MCENTQSLRIRTSAHISISRTWSEVGRGRRESPSRSRSSLSCSSEAIRAGSTKNQSTWQRPVERLWPERGGGSIPQTEESSRPPRPEQGVEPNVNASAPRRPTPHPQARRRNARTQRPPPHHRPRRLQRAGKTTLSTQHRPAGHTWGGAEGVPGWSPRSGRKHHDGVV